MTNASPRSIASGSPSARPPTRVPFRLARSANRNRPSCSSYSRACFREIYRSIVMQAVATASSRQIVLPRSNAHVLPSSGPLITSRTYITGPPSRGPDRRSSPQEAQLVNRDEQPLLEIEPEALRAAEFMQAQELLGGMVGRRIVSAQLEETRIAIETDDGSIYYFYGFMGEDSAGEAAANHTSP